MQGLKSQAVGEWQPCGDCFYTKELLFDMRWSGVDLAGKRVCCAPFGGPIAVIRDEREMVVVTGDSVQPVMRIYTAAGGLLGSAMWDTSSRLISWGWTPSLQLVCVESGGMVVVRALTGEKIKEVSLGAAVASEGVVHAHVDGSVVVVITSSGEIWIMSDVDAPRPMRLPSPPVAADLLARCCLAVQQPQHTVSGMLQVLVAAGPGSVLYSIDMEEVQEQALSLHPASPVTSLRQSPCGAFIAVFTADGRLVVMTSDLSRKLSEFETHADATPDAVEWCGSDAVVVQWSDVVLVLGPHGDHASWAAEDQVALASEVDGVRVVGSTRHDIIRKVPQPLSQVFSLGSTAPGATLWEARCLLDGGNARCDKLLRELADGLPAAVETCVEAAGADFNVSRQKALLQSAAYGRAFTGPSFKPHLMAETAHTLRILNAIRDPGIGLPLTAPQLRALGIRALLARLVLYRHWQLAFKIADSLTWAPKSLYEGALPTRLASSSSLTALTPPGSTPQPPTDALAATNRAALPMPNPVQMATLAVSAGALPARSAATALKEAVLSAWACARISSASKGDGLSISDAELKSQLMAKLKTCPGIAYAPLAAHAQEVGRRRLALQLLDEESSCALQVPLLLSLAEGAGRDKATGRPITAAGDNSSSEVEDALGRALKRAIESGDTDLVLHVLFNAYKQRPVQDFWAFLNTRALAKNLFVKYCKEREPELLETVLTTNNLSTDLGELKMSTAISTWCKARQDAIMGSNNNNNSEAGLTGLQNGLTVAAAKFNTARDHAWMGKAAADLATLRREQARLERETGQNVFMGCTLEATLQQLIKYGHHKQAAALRKQFSVPDKQWWWAKVRALAAARSWDGLHAFAAEKKSPIGYEPFLEVAKKFGAPKEVQARIVSRLPDSAAKAEAYSSLDYTREAAEVAARLKDSDLLRRITSAVQSATGPAGLASITQIKDRFLSGTAAGMPGQGQGGR